MDAVKFLFAFLFVLIPFILAHLWIWVVAWVAVLLLFISFELYGVYISKAKKTISRQFWEYSEKHKTLSRICVSGWLTFSVYLALHLLFRW